MKLEKTMTEFVLEQDSFRLKNFINESTIVSYNKILKYANFINQNLNIGMFVPAVFKDVEWVILEKPIDIYYRPDFGCQKYPQECYEEDLKTYEQALEKVLFKGFELRQGDFEKILIHDKQNKALGTFINNKFMFFPHFKKIENLISLKLELTETSKNLLK